MVLKACLALYKGTEDIRIAIAPKNQSRHI